VGAYQVRPGYGGRSGFDWSTSGSTGTFIPVELDWTPRFGADRLIGHYKLGGAYDTSTYPELGPNAGSMAGTSAAPGRRGRASFYALADQMVRRTGPNGLDGVIVFAGVSRVSGSSAPIRDLDFVGVTASGVVPGRSGDTSVSRPRASPSIRP
jgi:porin